MTKVEKMKEICLGFLCGLGISIVSILAGIGLAELTLLFLLGSS